MFLDQIQMGLQKKFRPIKKELPNSTSYGNPQACLTIRLSVSSSIMNLCMMMPFDRKKNKIHLLRLKLIASQEFIVCFTLECNLPACNKDYTINYIQDLLGALVFCLSMVLNAY